MNPEYTTSRAMPSIRLNMVAAAIAPEDFNICDIACGV